MSVHQGTSSPTPPGAGDPGCCPVGRGSQWPSRTPPAGARLKRRSRWPAGPPGRTACPRAPG